MNPAPFPRAKACDRKRKSRTFRLRMTSQQNKDPLHGVPLETILQRLVQEYGWRELGDTIPIQCFRYDPSIKSSLKFLRRTPWARKRVEDLYVRRFG